MCVHDCFLWYRKCISSARDFAICRQGMQCAWGQICRRQIMCCTCHWLIGESRARDTYAFIFHDDRLSRFTKSKVVQSNREVFCYVKYFLANFSSSAGISWNGDHWCLFLKIDKCSIKSIPCVNYDCQTFQPATIDLASWNSYEYSQP